MKISPVWLTSIQCPGLSMAPMISPVSMSIRMMRPARVSYVMFSTLSRCVMTQTWSSGVMKMFWVAPRWVHALRNSPCSSKIWIRLFSRSLA